MRLRSLAAASVLALPLLLAACGSDDEPDTDSTPTSAAEPGDDADDEGGTFPATVTHKYGETVVPEEPQRVVSVGVTEQDILLDLGVIPVGVTEWYGKQPDATWPWAHDLLEGAEPEVLNATDGLEFEKIAALEPDLIVGTNAGITKKDYALLSQIAPTVASAERLFSLTLNAPAPVSARMSSARLMLPFDLMIKLDAPATVLFFVIVPNETALAVSSVSPDVARLIAPVDKVPVAFIVTVPPVELKAPMVTSLLSFATLLLPPEMVALPPALIEPPTTFTLLLDVIDKAPLLAR